MHESILVYKNLLFVKLAIAVALAAVLAYAVHSPLDRPNGGTWLGYTLGGASAVLIVWLTWYGVRKRRYGPGSTNLEAWLSGHIYLGVALIVTATLHTGFQFGLNIHTLTYALMLVVVLSGVIGVYFYLRIPEAMTRNRNGHTRAEIILRISELGEECRKIAMGLSEEVNAAVFEASRESRIGGGFMRQLSGRDPGDPIAALVAQVEAMAGQASSDQADDFFRLVSALSRQRELFHQVRLDIRFQALMKVWLFIHVPFALALLAALTSHVIAVFFYW